MDRHKHIIGGAKRMNLEAWDIMENSNFVWYAIFVIAGHEFRSQSILKKHNIVSYLPLCVKWRRISRVSKQRRKTTIPAIGGFLFCALEKDENARYAIESSGVSKNIVSIKNIPAKLSGSVLKEFINHNRHKFSMFSNKARNKNIVKVGEKAHVTQGFLQGQFVDVVGIESNTAIILSELFGNVSNIKIDLEKLEKVECPPQSANTDVPHTSYDLNVHAA